MATRPSPALLLQTTKNLKYKLLSDLGGGALTVDETAQAIRDIMDCADCILSKSGLSQADQQIAASRVGESRAAIKASSATPSASSTPTPPPTTAPSSDYTEIQIREASLRNALAVGNLRDRSTALTAHQTLRQQLITTGDRQVPYQEIAASGDRKELFATELDYCRSFGGSNTRRMVLVSAVKGIG